MHEFISLPQLKIFSSEPAPSQKFLLIIGGDAPSSEWLIKCAASVDHIIAVDRGIDACLQSNLIPELLIGDLDSARIDSINRARSERIPIEQFPVDKDFTDLQLALKKIEGINPSDPISPINPINPIAVITGAFGGRVDHLYANIFSCAHSNVRTILADQSEIMCFVRPDTPITLSLLPITEVCSGVSIDGVHWSLEHAALRQSFPNAISNRVENKSVNVSISEGILAVAACFDR